MSSLVYISQANSHYAHGAKALHDLEMMSAARNAKSHLTGILVFSNGFFIQMIEGPETNLIATFERIRHDSTHHDVELITFEHGDNRLFLSWNMNLIELHEPPSMTKKRVDKLHQLVSSQPLLRCKDALEAFIAPH